MTKDELYQLIEEAFYVKGYNCAQTVLTYTAKYFNMNDDLLKEISAPFGGGLSGIRISVCGAISGGLMFIGIKDKENSALVGRELINFAQKKYGDINCDKILDIDFSNEEQVASEKLIKKKTICTPMIKDICSWLVDRYDN
ncbi:MAG: C_GCAxxG_C_C family protein [Clostridiales bacterium]|nr:C_GCAxxG_C_C family protein [Clostridiales bacterium]